MNSLKDKIKSLANNHFESIKGVRHHLHAHPELSFKEYKTADYIMSILDKLAIEYTSGWAKTGIVARIKGKDSSEYIALRADIDALPIQEANEVGYASKNDGVMHACGHDVHTSCLLGVAHILQDLEEKPPHDVVLIFQPGEEKLPGGASLLIKEGLFKDQKPKAIIGQHVHPPLATGKVGLKGGMYMASADEIYITVEGKGGHGALPQDCIDTILMASEVVTALQKVVSRNGNPTIPSVLTIGKINSVGGTTNVIPDQVKMEGTFRTMNEEWRTQAHQLIEKTINGVVSTMGGKCEVEIRKGYPFLMNNEPLTEVVKSKMIEFLGHDDVVDLPIRMTAEDFSYYTHEAPGCFYRLGTGNVARGITSSVHTPTFDIDEDALKTGMAMMAYLALSI